jgi:hypothetical protein
VYHARPAEAFSSGKGSTGRVIEFITHRIVKDGKKLEDYKMYIDNETGGAAVAPKETKLSAPRYKATKMPSKEDFPPFMVFYGKNDNYYKGLKSEKGARQFAEQKGGYVKTRDEYFGGEEKELSIKGPKSFSSEEDLFDHVQDNQSSLWDAVKEQAMQDLDYTEEDMDEEKPEDETNREAEAILLELAEKQGIKIG